MQYFVCFNVYGFVVCQFIFIDVVVFFVIVFYVVVSQQVFLYIFVEGVDYCGGNYFFWCVVDVVQYVDFVIWYVGENRGCDVVIGNSEYVYVQLLQLGNDCVVVWFCQYGDGQFVQWFVQGVGDIVQVFFQWQIEIDSVFSVWVDDQFFYIYIWCVEEVVFIVDCYYCQGVGLVYCCYVGVFDGIDGDIYCIVFVGIYFFVDIKYWCFIDFVFVDDDGVVDIDEVKYNVYGVNCCVVGGIFIVVVQLFIVCQCGGFGDM